MDQPQLCDLKCVPCRGGMPPLTRMEIEPLAKQVPAWKLADDALSISRTWKFRDYVEAEAFDREMGPKIRDAAEAEGHHPDIGYGWGYFRVTFTTHAIKGLHKNDFIMAAKVDALLP